MVKLIEKELSYKLQGIFIEISRGHGYLFKEKFYQSVLKEKLEKYRLKYKQEPKIGIYSLETKKLVCMYNPDFLIENRIIIELKAQPKLLKDHIAQLDQYLKASKYEIGYVVNFGTPKAQIIRRIYSNINKSWLEIRE